MGIIASLTSHVVYLSEKISLCCIAVLLVSCTMITITFTLAFGIGLGYNYCFVDLKTRYTYVPARYRYRGSPRWHGSRYARVGEDAETDEENLRNALPDIDPDRNNPISLPSSSPDILQDNEKIYEPQESLDDIRIPDDTTAVPIDNSTIEPSRDIMNVTDNTRASSAMNHTGELRTTKMVIPLSGLDLIGLLTRLRAENKNYTLQIVTD